MAHSSHAELDNSVPQLEELSSLLEEVANEDGDLGGGDFMVEELEMDLSEEEESLLFGEAEGDVLDQLLDIASRYPGLKITLSF